MPRKRQGGLVPGRPGTNYPNRTDLARQPSLPARAAQGQTYGAAQSQLSAQKTVPMAPPRLALPPAGSPAPAAAPGSGQITAQPGAAAPQPFIPPGGLGDLHRATERPNEPVTAGAALGPGPSQPPPMTALAGTNNVSAVLQKAAQATNSAVLQQMAARAQAAGQ